jgi:hypothetical protein
MENKEAFDISSAADSKAVAVMNRGRTIRDRRAPETKHSLESAVGSASSTHHLPPRPPSQTVKEAGVALMPTTKQFEERAALRKEKLATLKKEAMERVLQKRAMEEQHNK